MKILRIKTGSQPFEFTATGYYFRVLESAEPVKVRFYFNDGQSEEVELRSGLGVSFPPAQYSPFTKFEIESETEQRVEVFAGRAKIDDNRTEGLRVNLGGARELKASSASLVANQAKLIASYNGNRRNLLIKPDQNQATPVFIGGADVNDENGFLVQAGDALELPVTAEVYAYSTAITEVRTLEEIN